MKIPQTGTPLSQKFCFSSKKFFLGIVSNSFCESSPLPTNYYAWIRLW